MKYLSSFFAIIISSFCFSQVTTPVTIVGPDGTTQIINITNSPKDETVKTEEANPHTASHSRALFTISTDLAQYFLFQPNIDFEFHISYHSALGINAAIVSPCLLYAENPVASGGQYTDPGTVYGGTALRFYYKFYPGRQHKSYWSIQGVYKKLSYSGANFTDDFEDDAAKNFYSMNENETVYGIDIMHGNRLTREGDHFYADLFYGVGGHRRFRSYQVYDQTLMLAPGTEYSNLPIITDGNYRAVLNVITPVIGVKLGWNYLKKISN